MIVSFSVSNFCSFGDEQTFSLVANDKLPHTHPGHLVPIPDSDQKVLRTSVLYGANGAGKSNLFKALRYLRQIAIRPPNSSTGTGRQAFRFSNTATEPSTLDLQFLHNGRLYRFGCKVDERHILEEWLVQVVGSAERILYERVTDLNGDVTIEVTGLEQPSTKLNALATVGGPANQSFLATIHANLKPADIGPELSGILDWFGNKLCLIGPDDVYGQMGKRFAEDKDLLDFAGDFLRSSSTGVDRLQVVQTEVNPKELQGLFPDRHDLPKETLEKGRPLRLDLADGYELRKEGDRFYRTRIEAVHRQEEGQFISLPLNEESDGTRRLLHLVPALHHLRSASATFFIDEIERSLHPLLAARFLTSFLEAGAKGASQVIITTHESSLLDQDLLRRDEVWFAEKNQQAMTQLYSLTDFPVRQDQPLRKHYLQGRFGAVPFLGNVERLFPEPEKDFVA